MTQVQRPRRRSFRMVMEQGGWQPQLVLPRLESRHRHDPIGYLLIPLIGFLLVCAAVFAVLIHQIGPISPW